MLNITAFSPEYVARARSNGFLRKLVITLQEARIRKAAHHIVQRSELIDDLKDFHKRQLVR